MPARGNRDLALIWIQNACLKLAHTHTHPTQTHPHRFVQCLAHHCFWEFTQSLTTESLSSSALFCPEKWVHLFDTRTTAHMHMHKAYTLSHNPFASKAADCYLPFTSLTPNPPPFFLAVSFAICPSHFTFCPSITLTPPSCNLPRWISDRLTMRQ